MLLDGACAAVAGGVAWQLRFAGSIPGLSGVPDDLAQTYLALTAALPLVWIGALALAGAYERRFIGVGTEEFRRVLSAGVVLTALVAVLAYATQAELARGYVLVALPAVTVLSLVMHYAWRKRLHRWHRAGRCMRRTLVVGHASAVRELVRLLRREPHHGMTVVGVCLPAGQCFEYPEELEGCPVYGDFGTVSGAVSLAGADTVAVLACPELDGVALRRLAWCLERSGTELTVAPALMDVAGPRTSIRPVAGLPLLHVEHPQLSGGRRLVKGLVDRLAAGAALVLLAPVFVVLSVLIRLDSPGPALFTQTRVGKDGVPFSVYKFRTMVVDAEELKTRLQPRNEHDGVLFKIRGDPRVTAVGSWLRRYSLDELPQLVNVVAGHMSLVGPRPPLPDEVARYGHDVRRRLVVKPGMTGLWQVSGRSDLSWEESVRLDLRYVENWSLTLDVQILWKTCSAVIRGSGAY
ncbi:sugar transferase [Lipingzhangella rawalii]